MMIQIFERRKNDCSRALFPKMMTVLCQKRPGGPIDSSKADDSLCEEQ
jgi:hypothetical protein